MRQISLTQGQFAIVDDEDYKWLSKFKWYAHWDKKGQTYYAVRHSKRERGKQHEILMHREVLGLKRGDKCHSHHINHITLDNRNLNLQRVSNQENQFDQKKIPKGFYRDKRRKTYNACIGLNNKTIHLGCFHTTQEAHSAYLTAKQKYHRISVTLPLLHRHGHLEALRASI